MKKKNNLTYVIAEIGPNHNGSFKIASNMIKNLSSSGVNGIKFQLGNPDLIFSDDAFFAEYQKKNTIFKSIKDLSKKNQLSESDHIKLAKLCKKNNLDYLCSAFDLKSLKFIDKKLKIPFFKIPSGEVFSLDMIDYIAKQNKPILISTGMCNFAELEIILKRLNKFKKKDITILHCISSYPAEKRNLNLNLIDKISNNFNCKVGYSDHSTGDEASLAAIAKGAVIIEKHVTISKKMKGPDHSSSSTIVEFKGLIKKIRNLELMLGSQIKKFSEKEKNVKAASRKSITSKRVIKKNSIITMNDICFKRPGNGISPLQIKNVIGKKAKFEISKNKIFRKNFIKR